jgi:hypothetical protein
VLTTAAVVTAVLAVLALVVPQRLAAADWPRRCPAAALLLWQAVGVTAGLLTVQAVVTVALAPAGPTHARAVQAVLDGGAATRWWSLAAAVAAVVLVARLASVFTASAVRTLRARHRNRVSVDLVATRNPLLPGTRVVDHDRAAGVLPAGPAPAGRCCRAACSTCCARTRCGRCSPTRTPTWCSGTTSSCCRSPPSGRRSRAAARADRLRAGRAARRDARRRPGRCGRTRRRCWRGRLFKVGTASVPSGGLGATADGVLLRAQRLVSPLPALSWLELAAVAVATVAVLALPALCLLLPLLV